MPHLTVRSRLDGAGVERVLLPRDDVVGERAIEPGDGQAARFTLDHGPFTRYQRTVTVVPTVVPTGGSVEVVQRFDFALPRGTWPLLVSRPIRSALRHPRADGRLPWWYPPQRPDARSATVLGLLASLSIVVGYHGTLLSRTMTFAADEFGAGSAAQGDALAAARIGGILAVGLGALADRRGRRLVLSLSLLTCIASTVAGALSPSLAMLAGTQVMNRGAWAAASLLLGVIAAEEMPAGARAYALSLLAMTGALGAGIALWLLPIADTGERAWRILYVASLLFLPVVARFGRLVPESRRFTRVHRNVPLAGHYRRLVLVAGIFLLFNIFAGPQSQFLNEYLRDERGMSAAMISLFTVLTATPAGIGIVAGGRLADTRGRRAVGAVAASAGAVLTTLTFAFAGPAMWLAALLGGIVAAAMLPAVTVYGPELFPTSLRGRANGIVSMTAMGGSVIGLVAAGRLEEHLGSFGRAMGLLAVAPLAMAVVILLFLPETAHRELEELNPEDLSSPAGATHAGPGPGPDERVGDRPEGLGTAAPG